MELTAIGFRPIIMGGRGNGFPDSGQGGKMTKRKITAKEIFSIPNLMGYFRILLIPVFTWIYVQADSVSDYYTAAVLVGISGLTDMFDGKVARKFNMIT